MPLLLTYYAIRHRPSGAFMPAKMFRTASGGFSWWEPVPKAGYEPHSKLPRLFPDKHAASVALTYWLKGPVEKAHVVYDPDPLSDEAACAPVKHTTPESPRNRADMEIVRFDLKEIV